MVDWLSTVIQGFLCQTFSTDLLGLVLINNELTIFLCSCRVISVAISAWEQLVPSWTETWGLLLLSQCALSKQCFLFPCRGSRSVPEMLTITRTFPPIRGRMCILPVCACLTEETMRQVPLRMTCRLDQRFTGSASFPFLTLKTPESCTRSQPPTLRGLPGGRGGRRLTALLL